MITYVYFIGSVNTVTKSLTSIKIGNSRNPNKRLSQLQTGNANDLTMLKLIECQNEERAIELESFFHQNYDKYRLNGEWFSISADLLSDIYQNEADKSDVSEIKHATRAQRVAQRVLQVVQKTPHLSTRNIQNRMRWAHIEEIEDALETFVKQKKIEITMPKRTHLYYIPKGEK